MAFKLKYSQIHKYLDSNSFHQFGSVWQHNGLHFFFADWLTCYTQELTRPLKMNSVLESASSPVWRTISVLYFHCKL